MNPRLLMLCALLPFPPACQEQPPQTGHRAIAEEIRSLLDQSYAGIDAPTYRRQLQRLEAVVAAQREATPRELRKPLGHMLDYLRTAGDVLRWQAENPNGHLNPSQHPLADWIRRHPFLQAAVGARTAGGFDAPTALTLLWDKTNALLPQLQVKSKPL
jgi:hypothetical protein